MLEKEIAVFLKQHELGGAVHHLLRWRVQNLPVAGTYFGRHFDLRLRAGSGFREPVGFPFIGVVIFDRYGGVGQLLNPAGELGFRVNFLDV